jgi:hypothetical protein
MDSFITRNNNDLKALFALHHFVWLRAHELGWLLWPGTTRDGYTQACRAAKSWLERELVLARELPDGAGRIFVLAAAGVRKLHDNGITATSGKDVGTIKNGQWHPPITWKHDLLAHGVLVRLHADGWNVITEATIRRRQNNLIKIPDGLAIKGDKVMWIEVEQAHKSSYRDTKPLAQALSFAAIGQINPVAGYHPNMAAVAFDVDACNAQLHKENHQSRVKKLIQRHSRTDIEITWLACQTSRHGVTEMTQSVERIESDAALEVLQKLNACGWRKPDPDNTLLESNYGSIIVEIWEDEYGWHFGIRGDSNHESYDDADNISEAKISVARAIAARIKRT